MARITLSTLITAAVNAAVSSRVAQVLHGTGDPNGAVSAPIGALFCNTEAGGWNGARLWRKESGAGNTGWVVASGDTGSRLVAAAGTIPDMPQMFVCARRINNTVTYWCREGAAGTASTNKELWTPTAGFRLLEGGGANRSAVAPVFNAGTGTLVAGASLVAFSLGSPLVRLSAPVSGQRHYAAITDTTADAWPSTLPGTPA